MLRGADLPKSLWVEALAYAMWLINYALTRANDGVSPYELWEGRPPRLVHLCAFSECAYMHVLRHMCNKLGDTTRLVHYLGPARDASHHCVWVPRMCTMTEAHGLRFINDVLPMAALSTASTCPVASASTLCSNPIDELVSNHDVEGQLLPTGPPLSHNGGSSVDK